MKYIICDDNIEFSDLLKRNIQALEPHSTCIVYNSLSALKFNLEDIAEDTDAVFLDIRLKDGNGIKAARDISRDFPHLKFVYVTGYGDEYSQAIFENPIDTAPVAYLVKPVQQKYLKNALSKLKEHRRHDERFLSVKCNRSMVLVPTEKIMYISSDKRRLTIHTADGETVFYGKISKITDELSFSLLQIHKSYAVNMHRIKEIKNWSSVVLSDGTELSVGKSFIEPLKTYVTEHSVNVHNDEFSV